MIELEAPDPAAAAAADPAAETEREATERTATRPARADRPALLALLPPVLVGIWAALLVGNVVVRGVALEREQVIYWVLTGLAAACVASPRRIGRMLVDWLPFAGVLVVYDYSRGAAESLGMPLQGESIADIERTLFGGTVPTVWLQAHLYDGGPPRWWEAFVTLFYSSHFVVPFAVAGWLWWRDRSRWVAWARRFLLLTFMGLATYALVPAVPPWLASRAGFIGEVNRTASRGWSVLDIDVAHRLLSKGQGTVNLVAAMPSLHAGFAALVCVFFWRQSSAGTRLLLAIYPLGMGLSLVVSGEHYVIDVIAGWAYALLAALAVSWWERRRRRRRGGAEPPDGSRSDEELAKAQTPAQQPVAVEA